MTSPQFLGAKIHIFQKRNSIHSQTFFSFKTLLRLSQTCWDTLYVINWSAMTSSDRIWAYGDSNAICRFSSSMIDQYSIAYAWKVRKSWEEAIPKMALHTNKYKSGAAQFKLNWMIYVKDWFLICHAQDVLFSMQSLDWGFLLPPSLCSTSFRRSIYCIGIGVLFMGSLERRKTCWHYRSMSFLFSFVFFFIDHRLLYVGFLFPFVLFINNGSLQHKSTSSPRWLTNYRTYVFGL